MAKEKLDMVPFTFRVSREMWKQIRQVQKRAETASGMPVSDSAVVRKLLEDGLKKERRAAK